MKIEFADIVLLNHELKNQGTRYHVEYKDEDTGCIEPPGECCLTESMKKRAKECITEYYREKGEQVMFSDDFLYFSIREQEADEK